jgi:hypothetical protein
MKAMSKVKVSNNPIGKALIKGAKEWENLQGIQMRLPWSTDYR